MKTREQVLKENKWEEFIGYCFPSPRAENEEDLTFVEEKEAIKVMNQGVQTYWWNEQHDQLYELDTAWEYLYDDWCDEHLKENQDISFEDWEKTILKGD